MLFVDAKNLEAPIVVLTHGTYRIGTSSVSQSLVSSFVAFRRPSTLRIRRASFLEQPTGRVIVEQLCVPDARAARRALSAAASAA